MIQMNTLTSENKRFSLTEVLNDDSDFIEFLSQRAWHKIKSSPSWRQFLNANNRLENLEQQLAKISAKLDGIAISLNRGGCHD
jgi:hypothetical protein